jgi:hypothetical protein
MRPDKRRPVGAQELPARQFRVHARHRERVISLRPRYGSFGSVAAPREEGEITAPSHYHPPAEGIRATRA